MANKNRRPLVPEARPALNHLKADVMKKKGYNINKTNPNNVKFEVAKEQGIHLNQTYNGDIQAKNAGKIGGEIGGSMVKELIQMAKENLVQNNQPRS